jgi:hypothetical protein
MAPPRYHVPSCSTMLDLSALILGRQKQLSERCFRTQFGLPSLATKFIWDHLKNTEKHYDLRKFLMTLNYLKEGSNMEVFCCKWKMCFQTIMKWLKHGLALIISLLPDVSVSEISLSMHAKMSEHTFSE